MRLSTIDILSCPFCSGSIGASKITAGTENGKNIQFGLLNCNSCNLQFPVVGGVLILGNPDDKVNTYFESTQENIFVGPWISEICQSIADSDNVKALSLLLNPSGPEPNLLINPRKKRGDRNEWMGIQYSIPYGKATIPFKIKRKLAKYLRRLINTLSKESFLLKARKRLATFLLAHQKDLTAVEVIDLYYTSYSNSEISNYFTFRFGQPRYLAAVSIISLLRERDGIVVDLACGAGHLTHHLSYGRGLERPVIGMDRDFFRLYLATNYIAPEADYICYRVDQILPFSNGVCAGVFCSDAFDYFSDRALCLSEAQRITGPDGMIGIPRIGNRLKNPQNGGDPLSIEESSQLFRVLPHVIVGEDELMQAYLQKKAPNLQLREPDEATQNQMMLCAVLAKREADLRDYGSFAEFPHAKGRLLFNPIYRIHGKTESGGLKLEFQFPSEWYAFEDEKYLDYAPKSIDISSSVLASLHAGDRTQEIEDLISKFVLIGLPERYVQVAQ